MAEALQRGAVRVERRAVGVQVRPAERDPSLGSRFYVVEPPAAEQAFGMKFALAHDLYRLHLVAARQQDAQGILVARGRGQKIGHQQHHPGLLGLADVAAYGFLQIRPAGGGQRVEERPHARKAAAVAQVRRGDVRPRAGIGRRQSRDAQRVVARQYDVAERGHHVAGEVEFAVRGRGAHRRAGVEQQVEGDFALGRERLDHEMVEPADRVPVHVAEVVARGVVRVRLELHAPRLIRARDRRLAGPVAAGGPHVQPQPVQVAEEGGIG